MENLPFYGFIKKQETPLEQKADSTVTFVRGEMYRIILQSDELEKLKKYREFFPAEKGYKIALVSLDEERHNRYKIDAVLEGE